MNSSMEENGAIEKFIGVYLLILISADGTFLWPLTYFIAQEYIRPSKELTGLYAGLILFAYSLGKFISYKLISTASNACSLKWTMLILSIGSAGSIILLGIFPSYMIILLSRFLSGICSNVQGVTRKFIYRINFIQRGNWDLQSRKILFAVKIGSIIGICISCFLISPEDFLELDSKFVKNRYLLCVLIMFLLEISMVLLVFSIDQEGLKPIPAKKYVELPEKKEGDEEKAPKEQENSKEDKTLEEINQEQPNKKFDFGIFLESESIGNDYLDSQEHICVEEVKYYSPRQFANRPEMLRHPKSARPKFSESIHMPNPEESEVPEEKNPNDVDFKKTHISFIEEEFDPSKIPAPQKSQKPISITPSTEPSETLKFSFIYRAALTFLLSYTIEILPFYYIYDEYTKDPYILGVILSLSILFSSIFKLLFMDMICRKVKFGSLIGYILVLLGILVILVPIVSYFKGHLVIIVIIGGFMMCCGEILAPAGCVMVSDSVPLSLREIYIEKSDMVCMFIRSLGVFLGPFVLALIGVSFHFSLCALFLAVFAWKSMRINGYFQFMNEVPYKL
ncbi:hypothetical protein SteCoe_22606 [Stentor coeruleus]|uniref:Major facilitator superfamily (MFS) profile domain-containing protein n=1 Tax=Stentor coeruleus TaxID=5963 RepID=A0A1R2BLR7_9CILI|nr:hypothetical protein SteCoe_22606 [Stentor coeruleus]